MTILAKTEEYALGLSIGFFTSQIVYATLFYSLNTFVGAPRVDRKTLTLAASVLVASGFLSNILETRRSPFALTSYETGTLTGVVLAHLFRERVLLRE